ncbi:adenylate cyclase [Lewinellaceae bacterium SD302]|nr:adenylate cyclase [Lewinellaceae bacterium SD302]
MKKLLVEIKARCTKNDEIRKLLKERNARFIGTDHQIDTYYKVPDGRLKLREGKIENSLIFYRRENQAGPKDSHVTLSKMQEMPEGLNEVLTAALTRLVTVDKLREIYFIDNVKFHLDTVKELGNFVEIEAIGDPDKDRREDLLKQCEHYLQLFSITDEDLVECSYSDLLLRGS